MAAGWLTEYVRHHGYESHVVDLNAEIYNKESRPLVRDCWNRLFVAMDPYTFSQAVMEQHGAYIRSRLQELVDRGCRLFGMLLLDGNARFVGLVSQMIKELAPDAHVVVGGTGSTSLYRLRRRYGKEPPMQHAVDREMGQDHAIDSWCLGEGEETLMELLSRVRAGEDLQGIKGLALTADGPFAPFKERALIKDLDSLPHATFEGFDLDLYLYEALPFQLSRGCAFARCSHCGVKGYARGYRMRSPEHAIAELKYLIDRYGVREFHFTDLGVNGDLAGLEAFCDGVIREKLDIKWQSFVQIRGDMTPTLMSKIVESGCTSLNYGFESGSDLVLGLMRKPYTAGEAAKVLRMTHEAGGNAIINIMCGHPGETEEEFQRTLQFLEDNGEHIRMVASVGYTAVHIHSPLLDECEAFGIAVDGEGHWHSKDGEISLNVRNNRVHRVTEILRMLGIPCFEAFWEDEDEGDPDYVPAVVGDDVWLTLTEVHVISPGQDYDKPLDTARPVFIQVGYATGKDLRRAVFDVRILDLAGETAYVTPRATARRREVTVSEQGWVQMVLAHHELPPNTYILELWACLPHSEEPLDYHVHRVPLEITGAPGVADEVMTPHTWTQHGGPVPRLHTSPVVTVKVLDESRSEKLSLIAGEPLTIAVKLDATGGAGALIYYRLEDRQGLCIFESEGRSVDLTEPQVTEWTLENTDLEPGYYEVTVFLREGEHLHQRKILVELMPPGLDQNLEHIDVNPWAQWMILDQAPTPPGEGAKLMSLALFSHDAREGTFPPATNIIARIVISGLARGLTGLQCRTWITDEKQTLVTTRETATVTSPSGAVALDLHLSLNFPEGELEIHSALWDIQNDRPLDPVWSIPLIIKGG
jgi:hypothetical protein